ncbi:MAG: MATE family efflux transporter [Candidatus Neomarinimicrobiota bacterium]|nr:MATE family efflux transporter [Candidatus Neomarinimicrobiota bacterium]MDD3966305.1 MATE family efflux transporter [Candidatus Neomarinimicrobiota bacterium]
MNRIQIKESLLPVPGGIREMLAIAIPMVVSHACDTFMTFTDRMFLSRLGPEIMNAAMGGGIMASIMISFFMGLIGYSTALVAQYLGAGRKNACPLVTTQAFLLVIVAYVLILLLKPLAIDFFNLMRIPQEQIGPQTLYFNIIVFGTIMGLFRVALSSYFSGIGRTRVVMAASLSAMVVNIFLNYIFIYGKLGFPAMGIRGAAYGTLLGGLVSIIILFSGYFGRKNRREFNVGKSFRFYPQIVKKLLHFGYPAGLEFMLTFFAFNLMILIFHSMGNVTATATTIMFNWDMVSYVPLVGIEVGVTSLVGRYMGARDIPTAKKAAFSGLKVGAIYSLLTVILFVFFPKQLVHVFRPAASSAVFDQAVPIAVFMLRIAAVYVTVEAVIITFIGVLRGAGDTRWAMIVSVAMHYLMAGGIFIILKVLKLSPEIAWVVVVLVFTSLSVVFYLRFRSGKWEKIRIVESNIPGTGNFETPEQ